MSLDYEDLLGGSPAAPDVSLTVPSGTSGVSAAVGGQGYYEASDKFSKTLGLWHSPMVSADAAIIPNMEDVGGKTQELRRNDSYVSIAEETHKNDQIGAKLTLNHAPLSDAAIGRRDEVWETACQEEVEHKWELFAHSTDNWIDASRKMNFSMMARLMTGSALIYGEGFATVAWRKDDGSPYGTCIQLVEPARLSDPLDRVLPWQQIPNVRAGVETDSYGAPQFYYVRNTHPNDYNVRPFGTPKWDKIALRKPWGRIQVIHLFDQTWAEQTRGITQLVSALPALKQSHVWRDVVLQNAITEATFAAAITSDAVNQDALFQRLGGGGDISSEAVAKAIESYSEGYLSSVAKYVGNSRANYLNEVKIPRLFPGEKLEIMSPGKGGPLGTEFEHSLLRYVAAAAGISYEQLSRDYTHTNYSSARAAMLETWKSMQAKKKIIVDRFATMVFRLWLEEAINSGKIESAKGIKIYDDPLPGEKYGRLNEKFDALSRCDWIGGSRGQIDEVKETTAAQMRIQMGTSTLEKEAAVLGEDWRKILRQRARELKMCEELGLPPLSIDPALMTAVQAQAAQNQDQTA